MVPRGTTQPVGAEEASSGTQDPRALGVETRLVRRVIRGFNRVYVIEARVREGQGRRGSLQERRAVLEPGVRWARPGARDVARHQIDPRAPGSRAAGDGQGDGAGAAAH